MLVINETTGRVSDHRKLIRAIVAIYDGIIEFGYCSDDDPLIINTRICFEDYACNYIRGTEEVMKHIIYSNRQGRYILNTNLSSADIIRETQTFGRGGFPYNFEREYEAVNLFGIFKNRQQVVDEYQYPLSKYLKYSFGAEFETYAGYIPQDKCLRDGLIPLRDGSLDGGIEYSTVVLEGNKGLNLLKQQIDTLQKYTYFNKECSLHFHFGGYPVSDIHIWTLYVVWKLLANDIKRYVPEFTFNTAEYKRSRKDYCKRLPSFNTFGQLYANIAGQKYFGNLTQVHPADPAKRAKWNVHSRYYDLNLLNMMCYTGPKTIEFRFLRPTFNYHKITLWLYIFNAILRYCEEFANNIDSLGDVIKKLKARDITLERIIYSTYPADLASVLTKDLTCLSVVVQNQTAMNDYIGATTEIENQIIDPKVII